jgi:hypothetical protein
VENGPHVRVGVALAEVNEKHSTCLRIPTDVVHGFSEVPSSKGIIGSSAVSLSLRGGVARINSLEHDHRVGSDSEWQAMDGALTKAPLGGKRNWWQSPHRGKRGQQKGACSLKEKGCLRPERWEGPTRTT